MELLDRALEDLCAEARALRDEGHGCLVTYSPKVFIPLTKLCRDVCHYCTFARPPRRGERAYLVPAEVVAIAPAGARARAPAPAPPRRPAPGRPATRRSSRWETSRSSATAPPARSSRRWAIRQRSSTSR